MKMKKVLAAAAASVLAVSAVSVVASAATATITSSVPGYDLSNKRLAIYGGDAEEEYDISKVAAIEITVTYDDSDGAEWIGGNININTSVGSWQQSDWSNMGTADFDLISGQPYVWKLPVNLAEEEDYAYVGLAVYETNVATINIDSIRLLDADGNEVKPEGASAPVESTPDSTAPADTDTSKPNTNTGVEGIAAVVGVAAVAAGAMVVAKKRK